MLIRVVFWFTLVILLLPIADSAQKHNDNEIDVVQNFSLVHSVVMDASNFCHRNPRSCANAMVIVGKYSASARAYTMQLAEYILSARQENDPVVTGSVLKSQNSQNLE